MRNYLEEFIRELKNRNYSKNTIRTYSGHLKHFLEYSRTTDYEPEMRISLFLEKENHSPEQRRLAWSSIKLFYDLILNKTCPYKLDRVKTRKRLPDILTKLEILEILNSIQNEKHLLIISLLYGSGLRVSEVCGIKIKDINFDNLSLKIRDSKGHKDRITLISEKYAAPLKKLIINRGANEYLFISLNKKKYAVRTVQKIFTNALSKSEI
jgi:integrase/recombinase XerD